MTLLQFTAALTAANQQGAIMTTPITELEARAEQLLRYIDSAHGVAFLQATAGCAIPGAVAVERLRTALDNAHAVRMHGDDGH